MRAFVEFLNPFWKWCSDFGSKTQPLGNQLEWFVPFIEEWRMKNADASVDANNYEYANEMRTGYANRKIVIAYGFSK